MVASPGKLSPESCRRLAHAAAGLVVANAVAVLVGGWLLDIAAFKSVLPGLAPMKANTAAAFLLAGIALWLQVEREANRGSRRVAQACAVIVLVIGVVTLSEYLFGWDLRIDELLFLDPMATGSPGRMAQATALLFALLGGALLLLDCRSDWPTVVLVLSVFAGAFLALTGYLYGTDSLYAVPPYSAMALHTAASFAIMSMGILLARPERKFLAVLLSNTPGGILARRLLPAALFLPPCVGWLRLTGQRLGYFDARFGIAVGTLSAAGLFTALIYWTAVSLYRLDQERERAERKFRMAVESSPNGAVIVDRSGRIMLANAQMERMFGFNHNELLNQPIEMLIPDQFKEVHPKYRAHFFESPAVRRMGAGRELYGQRKNGSEFAVEIGLTPLDTDEGLFVLSTIVDITERKAAIEQLQRHQSEIAHVSRLNTMGEMAVGLADELNQPLSSLTNYASAAAERLAEGAAEPTQTREVLGQIVGEAERAAEIIGRLRRLTRKRDQPNTLICINELARDVVALTAFEARRRGVEVRLALSESLPMVLGDSVQLEQVLVNLVRNSFEAMESPSLRERVLQVKTQLCPGDVGKIEVSVIDSGVGVPEECMDRLFSAFFTTKPDGLGMGLSISRSIVEAHGGRLWAEARVRHGAVFRFTLPVPIGRPVRAT
ncbi:MAG TPA: PAS domain S-box protein [Planctomycetaceae bacterium]|nr:PAS domain S-box protein [Planctomycetaceae bacterium]